MRGALLQLRTTSACGLILGLLLGSLGCAGVPFWDDRAQQTDFRDAYRRYTQLVRWSEFDRASRYVDPAEIEAFQSMARELRGFHLTDYEVRSADLEPEGDAATVRVLYRAYSLASLVETVFEEVQEWRRDEATRTWRVRPRIAPAHAGSSQPRS